MPTSTVNPRRVFLSCVTPEFGDLRRELTDYLLRADCEVKVQEYFDQPSEDTVEQTDRIIQTCAAVIHLVGKAAGSSANKDAVKAFLGSFDADHPFLYKWPEARAAIGDGQGISYTQWEAYSAWHHRVNLRVYHAEGNATAYQPTALDTASQEAHVKRLKLMRRHGVAFGGKDDEGTLFQRSRDLLGLLIGDLNHIIPNLPEARPSNLGVSIGKLFKGRKTFLAKIRHTLAVPPRTNGAHASTVFNALHGMGGIGKTRLALEYGYNYKDEYSALLFVNGASPDALRRNLADLTGALVLHLPERDHPDQQERLAAALRWLAKNPRWLLIIDNVDTEQAAVAVEEMLPRLNQSGHVIITTRLTEWSSQVEPLEVEVLDEKAAVALLKDRSARGREKTPADATDVYRVADKLRGLALALEHAGAYIADQRISYAEYLEHFEKLTRTVLQWFNERTMRYHSAIAITWQASFDQLGPTERIMFCLLAFLDSAPIPRDLFKDEAVLAALNATRQVVDPTAPTLGWYEAQNALTRLSKLSLVRFLAKPRRTFSIHPLVQELVRLRGGVGHEEAAENSRTFAAGAVHMMAAAFVPPDTFDNNVYNLLPQLRQLVTHVHRVLEFLPPEADGGWPEAVGLARARLLRQLTEVYNRQQMRDQEEACAEQAVSESRALVARSAASVEAKTYLARALVAWSESHSYINLHEAEAMTREACAVVSSLPGEALDSPLLWQTVLITYISLVQRQSDLNNPAALHTCQATQSFARAIIDKNPTDLWTQNLQCHLLWYEGVIHETQGQNAEALEKFLAGQEQGQKLLQARPKSIAAQRNLGVYLSRIGACYSWESKFVEACEYFEQAAARSREVLAKDSDNPGLLWEAAYVCLALSQTIFDRPDSNAEASKPSLEEARRYLDRTGSRRDAILTQNVENELVLQNSPPLSYDTSSEAAPKLKFYHQVGQKLQQINLSDLAWQRSYWAERLTQPADAAELATLLNKYPEALERWGMPAETYTYEGWRLPFYDSLSLVLMTSHPPPTEGPEVAGPHYLWVLLGHEHMIQLNGNVGTVRLGNLRGPLNLTEDNVRDYLMFFCFFVRESGRPFLIVDASLARAAIAADGENPGDVCEAFNPSVLYFTSTGGGAMTTMIYFNGGLFQAKFRVAPRGNVRMLEDSGDLPPLAIS